MVQEQISDYKGRCVVVKCTNGDIVDGRLSFFNYANQVLHLSKYAMHRHSGETESGEFIVLNKGEWASVAVKGDEKYD